jgi:hypothetical protein
MLEENQKNVEEFKKAFFEVLNPIFLPILTMRFYFQHEYGLFFKNPINWIFNFELFNIMFLALSYVYFTDGLYIRLWVLNFRFEFQFNLKRGKKYAKKNDK